MMANPSKDFNEMIREVYNKYDKDQSGILDHKELRFLVDDLRLSLNLLPSDKDIQDRIIKILDSNNDCVIDINEFLENIPSVLPV